MEAKWETTPAGETAPWSLLAIPDEKNGRNQWELDIPNGLGYLLEFQPKLSEPVLGLNEWAPRDRPRMVGLIYYSFRIMSGIGVFLVGLMLWSVVQWLRGALSPERIAQQKLWLYAWIFAAPLGYIAVETGWIVRCVGRQPWTMYGKIRTADAASQLPAGTVLTSLVMFAVIYSILFVATLYFGSRIIKQGPNLELLPPGAVENTAVNTNRSTFIPDQRPVEAQQ
jgi:cytochrome bd ubiquinol oxidase subunit I